MSTEDLERTPSRRRRRTHEASTAEVLATARRVLAERGVDGLTLSAVARELDVVPSALYRYVGSRDELIATLLGDAYTDLADAVERAAASTPDPVRGMVAAADAWRAWAHRFPGEFVLVFGPPVAGVQGGDTDGGDAVHDAGKRTCTAFAGLVRAVRVPERVTAGVGFPAGSLSGELAGMAREFCGDDDPQIGALFVLGWMRIQGHLMAEMFGNPPATEMDAGLFDLMLFGMLVDAGTDVDRARAALQR